MKKIAIAGPIPRDYIITHQGDLIQKCGGGTVTHWERCEHKEKHSKFSNRFKKRMKSFQRVICNDFYTSLSTTT